METKIYKITSPHDEAIKEVGRILEGGGLVAIPTETVYGLAGNALDGETACKIFSAKGRPSDNPLIVHISRFEQWTPLVKHIPDTAKALAEAFWPGPITMILPKSDLVPQAVCGKLDTVAVRMPENEIALAIIESAGVPLAAPSANLSGKPSPTCAEHVIEDMTGRIDAIVDSGDCSVGVESTVLSLVTDVPRVLRPGKITAEMIAEVVGEAEIDDAVFEKLREGQAVSSPGTKYKHYSPEAAVVLVRGDFEKYASYVRENAAEGTVALCFEGEEEKLCVPCVTYGKKNDPASQAKNVFDALRAVDKIGAKKVFARFPESEGMGLAVFNRLLRAAAFNIIEL
ncbi:MAG: threonylcarbamoyl-AMP synthase [Ruminococcaceae bacterium]|nr:threonylcarbamoyl-AMP synthase [Oscillospiraceae bacterium]